MKRSFTITDKQDEWLHKQRNSSAIVREAIDLLMEYRKAQRAAEREQRKRAKEGKS